MRRLRGPHQFWRQILGVERVIVVSVVVDQLGLQDGQERDRSDQKRSHEMDAGEALTGKPSITLASPLMTIIRFVLSSFSHVAIALASSVASTSFARCGSLMAILLTITARKEDRSEEGECHQYGSLALMTL